MITDVSGDFLTFKFHFYNTLKFTPCKIFDPDANELTADFPLIWIFMAFT